MKLMSEYIFDLKFVMVTLHYAKNPNLGKWLEMTSPVVPSQCLPINFNIFNKIKYHVA